MNEPSPRRGAVAEDWAEKAGAPIPAAGTRPIWSGCLSASWLHGLQRPPSAIRHLRRPRDPPRPVPAP
jgi:hypothetical protein